MTKLELSIKLEKDFQKRMQEKHEMWEYLKKALDEQEEASKIKCRVRRNGKLVELNIDDVVVGDIVLLTTGDKVPADGVLINGELEVDESSLNGETKASNKE